MLDIRMNIKDEQVNIKISITTNDEFEGGVYMFLIDEVPLYIGETNIFLKRLTEHLYALKKNKSYFGLGKLEGKHKITYIILNNKLPYAPDYKEKENEKLKIVRDKNRIKRETEQNKFIIDYRPLIQNPNFLTNMSKIKARKKDGIISNVPTRNFIVEVGLARYKETYNNIIASIKNEYQIN